MLKFSPITRDHVCEMHTWLYAEPYQIYDATGSITDEAIAHFLQPEVNYYAVANESEEMIAFRCFGSDARCRVETILQIPLIWAEESDRI